jgi:hypothetical protein
MMELDVYLALLSAGVDEEKAAVLARAIKLKIAQLVAAKFNQPSSNTALYDNSYV